MSDNHDGYLAHIARNDRYFLALFSAFLLGLILVFEDKIPDGIKSKLIPAMVLYCLSSALVAQIQNMIGNRIQLRLKGDERWEGIPDHAFKLICLSHIACLLSLAVYIVFVLRIEFLKP